MTSVAPDGSYTLQGCYGDGGGGRGGDDGGSSPYPGDPYIWDDGTGRPECERGWDGFCKTREVSEDEWNKFVARVEAIRETSPECIGAKQAIRGLVAQGRQALRIQFWDGYDKPTTTTQRYGQNLSDIGGRYIIFDSYWVWNLSTVIAHEALHLYLHQTNSPLMGDENEEWVEATAPSCV